MKFKKISIHYNMTTRSKRDLSIDLFNVPPLPDSNKRSTMDAYMDIPNNFYIPDGKNSRLMNIVDRREFEQKTVDGNEGFVLQIPFLECAFGTKYFIVDKQNGYMMGIFDDKVETIEAEAQMKPFNLAQHQLWIECSILVLHMTLNLSTL